MNIFFQFTLLTAATIALAAPAGLHETFSSQQAYTHTATIAGFGERWPGSAGHKKTEDLIVATLHKNGAQIESDEFVAATPRGPVKVRNIVGKFNVKPDSR